MPPRPAPKEASAPPKPPPSRRRLYLIIGAIVALILIAVVVVFAWPKSKGKTSAPATAHGEKAPAAVSTAPSFNPTAYWIPITKEIVVVINTNTLGRQRTGVFLLDTDGFPRDPATADKLYGSIAGQSNKKTIIVRLNVRSSKPQLVERLNMNRQKTLSACTTALSSLPATALAGPAAKEQTKQYLMNALDSVLGRGLVEEIDLLEFALE